MSKSIFGGSSDVTALTTELDSAAIATNEEDITLLQTNKVDKAGDTMTGTLDMGTNKITSTYVPVDDADVCNKLYVDANTGNVDLTPLQDAIATNDSNITTNSTNIDSNESNITVLQENVSTLQDTTLQNIYDQTPLSKIITTEDDNTKGIIIKNGYTTDNTNTLLTIQSNDGSDVLTMTAEGHLTLEQLHTNQSVTTASLTVDNSNPVVSIIDQGNDSITDPTLVNGQINFRDKNGLTVATIIYANESLVLTADGAKGIRVYDTNDTGFCPLISGGSDLGKSDLTWNDAYFNGLVQTGALSVSRGLPAISIVDTDNDFTVNPELVNGKLEIKDLNGTVVGNFRYYNETMIVSGFGANGIKVYSIAGNFSHLTNNTCDLGNATEKWKDAYIGGNINLTNKIESEHAISIDSNSIIIDDDFAVGSSSYGGTVENSAVFQTGHVQLTQEVGAELYGQINYNTGDLGSDFTFEANIEFKDGSGSDGAEVFMYYGSVDPATNPTFNSTVVTGFAVQVQTNSNVIAIKKNGTVIKSINVNPIYVKDTIYNVKWVVTNGDTHNIYLDDVLKLTHTSTVTSYQYSGVGARTPILLSTEYRVHDFKVSAVQPTTSVKFNLTMPQSGSEQFTAGYGTDNVISIIPSSISFNKPIIKNYTEITSNYYILETDYMVACNTASAILVYLPIIADLTTPGKQLYLIIKDISGNPDILINGQNGNMIDGVPTLALSGAYNSIHFFTNGVNWFKI
jgi:hypothetical protein